MYNYGNRNTIVKSSGVDMIDDLDKKGEKLLKDNLVNDEKVLIKLKGTFKEAFVLTDKRLYVLKWGFMTGNTFGGRCIAYDFNNITGVEFKKHFSTGYVEIHTPSNQNTQKSYWANSNSSNSSLKADNIVNFVRKQFDIFQEAVNKTRVIISDAKVPNSVQTQKETSDVSVADELVKLANLKEQGIITQEEFQREKDRLLK